MRPLAPDEAEIADAANEIRRRCLAVLEAAVLQDDGELVAADAGDDVARPHRFGERAGEVAQQLVAGDVAGGVVDDLELVDVEEHQAARYAAQPRRLHRPSDLALEGKAVEETGEDVVIAAPLELGDHPLALADVAQRQHRAVGMAVGGADRLGDELDDGAPPGAAGQHRRHLGADLAAGPDRLDGEVGQARPRRVEGQRHHLVQGAADRLLARPLGHRCRRRVEELDETARVDLDQALVQRRQHLDGDLALALGAGEPALQAGDVVEGDDDAVGRPVAGDIGCQARLEGALAGDEGHHQALAGGDHLGEALDDLRAQRRPPTDRRQRVALAQHRRRAQPLELRREAANAEVPPEHQRRHGDAALHRLEFVAAHLQPRHPGSEFVAEGAEFGAARAQLRGLRRELLDVRGRGVTVRWRRGDGLGRRPLDAGQHEEAALLHLRKGVDDEPRPVIGGVGRHRQRDHRRLAAPPRPRHRPPQRPGEVGAHHVGDKQARRSGLQLGQRAGVAEREPDVAVRIDRERRRHRKRRALLDDEAAQRVCRGIDPRQAGRVRHPPGSARPIEPAVQNVRREAVGRAHAVFGARQQNAFAAQGVVEGADRPLAGVRGQRREPHPADDDVDPGERRITGDVVDGEGHPVADRRAHPVAARLGGEIAAEEPRRQRRHRVGTIEADAGVADRVGVAVGGEDLQECLAAGGAPRLLADHGDGIGLAAGAAPDHPHAHRLATGAPPDQRLHMPAQRLEPGGVVEDGAACRRNTGRTDG